MSTKPKPAEAKIQPPRQFQAPKGMHDLLPADAPYWEMIEGAAKRIARAHGFSRLDPPVLEFADLYNKTSGDESDIVEKEMYTMKTKGGDVLALRPEYTPGMSRAYLEHGLSRLGQPQKLFTVGPVFRHERPQLGRYRQFSQIDFEVLGGVNDPIYDAEVILIAVTLLREVGITELSLRINSIGCRICRPIYRKQLFNYYKNHEHGLCDDCVRRLKTNPLRLLDCKEESCLELREKAPNILDKLCVTCSAHFRGVLEYLDETNIAYELDNRLVRGLDYYSRTVFEIYAAGEEAGIGALPGGGRYDYLMETIGGHLTPAVGFGCGVERLIAVMRSKGIAPPERKEKKVFVVHAGELAKKKAFALAQRLRAEGIAVAEALARESLGAQLKVADKEGVEIALILGQKEIYEKSVIVRDLANGLQEAVPDEKLVGEIRKRLK
ncbi:MAG TPA: histidine--tRNA ligase [Candidatus Paceibacterota bacterium]|nr:histidine--tRNA ligase [Candidatus Paceibacterota bacterium]